MNNLPHQEVGYVAPEDRVPFKQNLAYGIAGPVDILAVWLLVSIAYPLFNMERGMSPTRIAFILMSLRLWDGMVDPVVGWISDNTRSRWGRRRPFIFVGSMLTAITFPLIWWFPRDLSEGHLMAWVIGFGIVFYTSFAIWAMPYQSLLMEMTPDYNERTKVAAFRGITQALASFIVGSSWWIAFRFHDPITGAPSVVEGMRTMSLYIAVLMGICGILPALFVHERYYEHQLARKQKGIGLIRGFKETISCRPFVILCLLTVFFLLGTSIYDSYGRYVGTYYVLGGDLNRSSLFQIYGTSIYMVCSLFFIPFFRHLSERIGKKQCLGISLTLVLISGASTWFTNNPAHPYLMLVNTSFIGAGYAGLWLMIPSMQADVVDSDELTTGERREGSFAAIYSWVLKLSFCIGFMISGPLLEWTGFQASLGGHQPPEVLHSLRVGYVALPVVTLSIAMLFLRLFPITRERAAEIRQALEEHRGKV